MSGRTRKATAFTLPSPGGMVTLLRDHVCRRSEHMVTQRRVTMPPARRGFTLLEMLVATAMVAVLAGSLYASLSIAFKAQRSALATIEPVRKVEIALAMLGEDLRGAVVPKGRLAGPFLGSDAKDDRGHDADVLEFYTVSGSPEQAEGIGDIKLVELLSEPSEDLRSQVLVRYVTTNLLAPKTVEPTREVLCRGVYALSLRYFNGSEWLDTWDSTVEDNTLPSAIEVTLQLEDARRADSGGSTGYYASKVFMIPCGPPPSTSTQVISGGSS